ncbi:MAG: hypothetical protein JNJ73_01070 [Hyphomonadaceae bacterium]|nr:hypothetical protein [Hyphomonadaceae bacterium]
MLFHISMPADNPARVSAAIAELWGGESLAFPHFPGAFIAMAGDDRASAIEVYPRGLALYPGDGMNEVEARFSPGADRQGPCHVAIATPLSEAQVHALAWREGWTSKTLCRGGVFHVIEFWVEDSFMIEVLTPEMQAEYTGRISIEAWRGMLAAIASAPRERVLAHA